MTKQISSFPFIVLVSLIIFSTVGESNEAESNVKIKTWAYTFSVLPVPKYYSYNLESSHKSSQTKVRQSSGEEDTFSTLHKKTKIEIRRSSSDLEMSAINKTNSVNFPLQFLLHRSINEVNQTNHQSGSFSYNIQRSNHEIIEESIANSSVVGSKTHHGQPSSKFNHISILQNVSTIIDNSSRQGTLQSTTKRKFNNETDQTVAHSLMLTRNHNNENNTETLQIPGEMTESKSQADDDGLDSVFLEIEKNTGPIQQGLGSELEPKINKLNEDTRKSSITVTHSGSNKFWFDFDEKQWSKTQ